MGGPFGHSYRMIFATEWNFSMAGKNVNVQGAKSCADRFAMLIFSKGGENF